MKNDEQNKIKKKTHTHTNKQKDPSLLSSCMKTRREWRNKKKKKKGGKVTSFFELNLRFLAFAS